MREAHPDWIHCREAAAGYHVRTSNHAGFQADSTWAYELHLAIACAGGIKQGPVPRVALGVAFDTLAGRIGENSLITLQSATQVSRSLGIKPGVVEADRAILPNSQPKKFQWPAR